MMTFLFRMTTYCGLLLAILTPSRCSARDAQDPDVLLITIDTLRADHLGCYGFETARTPVLDSLAAEGVRYDFCEAPVPVTLPSHASILTGQLPAEHGVRNNTTYRLPESVPTLAESMKRAGFRTGAFISALPLRAYHGLDRGFDEYDEDLDASREEGLHFDRRMAEDVRRAATTWIERQDGGAPLFVWVHFFDPHLPYELPEPFDREFREDPYSGEIAYVDQQIGELLAAVQSCRSRDLLTVVTADHGEGLGDHGEATHGLFLFESTLRVPLIFHFPGRLPAGVTVEEPVGLIDIAPTVLTLVGVDSPEMHPSGIVLHPGTTAPPRRNLYAETLFPMEVFRWSPAFALRRGERKVIRSVRSRAHDLSEDPGESADLLALADPPKWSALMLTALDSAVASWADETQASSRQPTPEEIEALSALGYVGGVALAEETDENSIVQAMRELPDASERLDEVKAIMQASADLTRGGPARSIAALEAVLDRSPDNIRARMLLGQAQSQAGQVDDAIATFEQVDQLRPGLLETELNLARLEERAGHPSRAGEHYRRALALGPGHGEVLLEVAGHLQQQARYEDGIDLLERALQEQDWKPATTARIEGALARLLLQVGRIEAGRRHLAAARRQSQDPALAVVEAMYLRREGRWREIVTLLAKPTGDRTTRAEAYLELAQAWQQLGERQRAIDSYRECLRLDDTMHLAYNNLAWILATELDRPDEALEHARRAIELVPSDAEYQDTYLEVLERLGRLEDARAHWLELPPELRSHASLHQRALRYGSH